MDRAPENRADGAFEDPDELDRARRVRRQSVLSLPMNERLKRLHELCRQMSVIKDSARDR